MGDTADFLAKMSGLSREEILWTFCRMRALRAEGKTPAEAKAIVKEETKSKPWEGGAQ